MTRYFTWIVALASIGWACWELRHGYNTRAMARTYVDAREGDAVCRPDGKAWNTSGKGAFVIIINDTCQACEVIKPLEARIDDYGRFHGVPTFYLVYQGNKNENLASQLKSAGKLVIRIESLKFGVNKVPTFMRVNDTGTIQAMWVGAAPDERRDAAFDLITRGRTDRGYEVAPSSEMAAYVANAGYQILALSDTGRLQKRAKVLPLADLYIRAKYELNANLGVAVDCASSPSAGACQDAARILVGLGG